jgi:hypothetical protein
MNVSGHGDELMKCIFFLDFNIIDENI